MYYDTFIKKKKINDIWALFYVYIVEKGKKKWKLYKSRKGKE